MVLQHARSQRDQGGKTGSSNNNNNYKPLEWINLSKRLEFARNDKQISLRAENFITSYLNWSLVLFVSPTGRADDCKVE